MKKLSLIYFFVFVVSIPFTVYAHVTKTDGDISVLMHIEPDCEAVAKTRNNLFFLITDKSKKFSLDECHCVATIFESGNKVSESKITKSFVSVFFPKKAVYLVEVTGKPIDGTSFQPFKIIFDARVEKEADNQIKLFFKMYQIPIVLSIVIFILVLTLVLKIRKLHK